MQNRILLYFPQGKAFGLHKKRRDIVKTKKKGGKWLSVWKARYLYFLLAPLVIWLTVFSYVPMYGILLAFKKYNARLGILGSPWVGLAHFRRMFVTPAALQAVVNTFEISIGRLIFEFPIAIIIAILITEMRGKRVKKIYQTIYTFPHFLSWIVVANIVTNFLASDGAVNMLLQNLGIARVDFLASKSFFRPLLYITSNWKEAGWSAIIYMAAIAGIDPTLYEAARVDGASRMRQIWHITLPGIKTTIAVMFILAVGGMLNAGFDQIFNLSNNVVKDVGQILDTYIYDITFLSSPDYGFSTAVGLFKAVVNFFMLVAANQVVYKLTGERMFG